MKYTFDNGKTSDLRHCYIMFRENSSANQVIMHPKRHSIKGEEIRIHRNYGIAEGDDTDKKVFIKVSPKATNLE